MSLSPFDSFQSRFVTYLLNLLRILLLNQCLFEVICLHPVYLKIPTYLQSRNSHTKFFVSILFPQFYRIFIHLQLVFLHVITARHLLIN